MRLIGAIQKAAKTRDDGRWQASQPRPLDAITNHLRARLHYAAADFRGPESRRLLQRVAVDVGNKTKTHRHTPKVECFGYFRSEEFKVRYRKPPYQGQLVIFPRLSLMVLVVSWLNSYRGDFTIVTIAVFVIGNWLEFPFSVCVDPSQETNRILCCCQFFSRWTLTPSINRWDWSIALFQDSITGFTFFIHELHSPINAFVMNSIRWDCVPFSSFCAADLLGSGWTVETRP